MNESRTHKCATQQHCHVYGHGHQSTPEVAHLLWTSDHYSLLEEEDKGGGGGKVAEYQHARQMQSFLANILSHFKL